MNTRVLGTALVFTLGCAIGSAASRFVVLSANAQQAATLVRWDYMCFEQIGARPVEVRAKKAGADGWELTGVSSGTQTIGNNTTWCFKRPLI